MAGSLRQAPIQRQYEDAYQYQSIMGPLVRLEAQMQPRCSRDAAESQPRASREPAESQPRGSMHTGQAPSCAARGDDGLREAHSHYLLL